MEIIEVYDIAEQACKRTLERVYKTEEEGMAHIGKRQFEKMVRAVEAELERFTTHEDEDR
jgi:hypothetical protein